MVSFTCTNCHNRYYDIPMERNLLYFCSCECADQYEREREYFYEKEKLTVAQLQEAEEKRIYNEKIQQQIDDENTIKGLIQYFNFFYI